MLILCCYNSSHHFFGTNGTRQRGHFFRHNGQRIMVNGGQQYGAGVSLTIAKRRFLYLVSIITCSFNVLQAHGGTRATRGALVLGSLHLVNQGASEFSEAVPSAFVTIFAI